MKAKEILTKIIATNYSRSTMQKLFHIAARDGEQADKISQLIDETGSEEEILRRLEENPTYFQ